MTNENKGLESVIVIGGLSIGAYLLYKYFKKEDIEEGFNISKIEISPPKIFIGSEVIITVIGINKTDTGNCFCRLIDLDTQQEIFYDSALVEKNELKSFIFTTIMSKSELKLRIETGKIIDSIEEIHTSTNITIKADPALSIKSTAFYQQL